MLTHLCFQRDLVFRSPLFQFWNTYARRDNLGHCILASDEPRQDSGQAHNRNDWIDTSTIHFGVLDLQTAIVGVKRALQHHTFWWWLQIEPMSQKTYVVLGRTQVQKCCVPWRSPHGPIE